MRKVTYKQDIKNHVTKIGGNLIDQLTTDYYNKGSIPEWVEQIALDHKKASVQVINDLTRYRNSWDYTKTIKPERTKVI